MSMLSLRAPFGALRPSAQRRQVRSAAAETTPSAAATAVSSRRMLQWMSENGLPEQGVTLATVEREGVEIDVTVATHSVQPGDVVLRIPENLVVTLDRIFEDGAVAELLTTNKLSELAVLALYLMYEKKRGKESFWYPYIKELDRQAGRGPQGAKSPLLWEPEQVSEWLQGSPVVGQIEQRLAGIRKEYEELDTVWFMAGSLFKNYPFDVPTEAFSMDRFLQAFAAVQSSVVHLQGVPLSKRFALVPLGPPLLTYSSASKAMLQYNAETNQVQLAVDRAFSAGEPVVAWCGPQPNSRLLINYGVVDDNNPYDKLPLSITIPNDDPLFRLKRTRLAENELSTQHTFQLSAAAPLPPLLLPLLRITYARSESEVAAVQFTDTPGSIAENPATEALAIGQLALHLKRRLSGYKTTIAEDEAIIADPTSGPRQTVAARLVRNEKNILQKALSELLSRPGAEEAAAKASAEDAAGVKFA